MDDLISRQAAIDEIDSYEVNAPDYMQAWEIKLIEAIKGDFRGLISELPSAQPERKTGKWIENEFLDPICSVCGTNFEYAALEVNVLEWPFCPICGSAMKGGDSK